MADHGWDHWWRIQRQTAESGRLVAVPDLAAWRGNSAGLWHDPCFSQSDRFTTILRRHHPRAKGGGGGKGGGQQYKYSASVIMGVCQGPIVGIGTVWWDKNVGTLSSLPASVYLGNDGQEADAYWQTNHPAKALGYSGTATVVANNYAMGDTATLRIFRLK